MKADGFLVVGLALFFGAAGASADWTVAWPSWTGTQNGQEAVFTDAEGNTWSIYGSSLTALDDPNPTLADWQSSPAVWSDTFWAAGANLADAGVKIINGDYDYTVIMARGVAEENAGYVIEVAAAGQYDWVGEVTRLPVWTWGGPSHLRFGKYNADGSGWQELASFDVAYDQTVELTGDYGVAPAQLNAGDLLVVGFRTPWNRTEMGLTTLSFSSSSQVVGDADLNGVVDDSDLSLLLANWGQDRTGDPDGGWGKGEFSGTAPVDDSDLSLLLANWTTAGALPEPCTMLLLAWGGLLGLRRRR